MTEKERINYILTQRIIYTLITGCTQGRSVHNCKANTKQKFKNILKDGLVCHTAAPTHRVRREYDMNLTHNRNIGYSGVSTAKWTQPCR